MPQRGSGTKDVRVLPDGGRGKWKVTVDGERVSGHRTKEKAVDVGRREAKRGGDSAELRVHKLDGVIQEERTYGKPDPPETPG